MKVLIVSPHFPPTNAPDMQRIRLLLPYFKQNGVEPEVLAVEADQTAFSADTWLEAGLPGEIPIHRVRALGLRWSKIPGLGGLGFRAMHALAQLGDQILANLDFDLVYFSTTVFEIHVLGPRWKRKFGVPFVLDYQDPWVNDYYRDHPNVRPPGGRIKYFIVDRIHRRMERGVLLECVGITSVSPVYPIQLRHRYSAFGSLPSLIQPFPGDLTDLQRAASDCEMQAVFDHGDGKLHWVYAGVVIPAMHGILRAFFLALRKALDGGWPQKLRIHFIGTNYAVNAVPVIEPIASECGVSELVEELPRRIPYSQVLACLSIADALLVIGSDDPGYTASKIYPYLLAKKPMLAVFHRESSVASLMEKVGGGICVDFSNEEPTGAIADRITDAWFKERRWEYSVPLDEAAFKPYTAPAAAVQLSDFFHHCLECSRNR